MKVVTLNGEAVDSVGTPPENVIEALEGLLKRAKNGELRSIAVAWVRGNQRPGFMTAHGDGSIFALHSGTMMLVGMIEEEMEIVEAPPTIEET